MVRYDYRYPGSLPPVRVAPERPGSERPALRLVPKVRDDVRLLEEIEAFLRARHQAGRPIATSIFGIEAAGNPSLVQRLRQGTRPRPETVARVRAYIREHAA